MSRKVETQRTQLIVTSAFLIALLTSVTLILKIPMPIGYIHLGDVLVMAVALLMPFRLSLLIVGIGCALADILGGYMMYSVFTFFIKIAGAILIYMFRNRLEGHFRIVALCIANGAMLVLYGFTDVLLTQQWQQFWPSVGYNLPQTLVAIVVTYAAYPYIMKLKKYL